MAATPPEIGPVEIEGFAIVTGHRFVTNQLNRLLAKMPNVLEIEISTKPGLFRPGRLPPPIGSTIKFRCQGFTEEGVPISPVYADDADPSG